MKQRQRGNTVIGLIIGIVLGLGVALGIAVYVTKVPIPFMTKTQRGGAEQDQAEALKNKDWDPNGPLAGKGARGPVQTGPVTPVAPATPTNPTSSNPVPVVVAPSASPNAAASAAARAAARVTPTEAGKPATSSDPLGDLARARAGDGATPSTTDAFMYFVQAGAFRTTEDAEAQRAKLSLMGVEAKVTEREQAGRTVYRVRAGPFNKKDDADRLKDRLDGGGLESALVRVQR